MDMRNGEKKMKFGPTPWAAGHVRQDCSIDPLPGEAKGAKGAARWSDSSSYSFRKLSRGSATVRVCMAAELG
jgi:hypothetical protein